MEHYDALSHDLSFRGWDWELDPLHLLWSDTEDIVDVLYIIFETPVNHFCNIDETDETIYVIFFWDLGLNDL